MLKISRKNSLFGTLKKLDIPINDIFGDQFGYFKSHVSNVVEFANRNSLFINKLNDGEIIISDKEVCLGKKEIFFESGCVKIKYHSNQEFLKLKSIYEEIKFVDCVPIMSFDENIVTQKYYYGTTLHKAKVNKKHKYALIDFIRCMNLLGYAHRDLHCKNIIISADNLIVVDWDFVTEQRCDLLDSYDLVGYGLPSPHLTYNTNIFKRYPKIGVRSVADILCITKKDFF